MNALIAELENSIITLEAVLEFKNQQLQDEWKEKAEREEYIEKLEKTLLNIQSHLDCMPELNAKYCNREIEEALEISNG